MVILAFAEGAIQLVPDGTILFHLAAIIVMVAVLNATLLKPINRILEERERRTRGRLSEAQQTLLTVDEKLRDYERRLRAARAEGYALMEQERLASAAQRDKKLGAVRTEISQGLAKEKNKIKEEIANVKETLRGEARDRAVEISRRILHRPVGGDTRVS